MEIKHGFTELALVSLASIDNEVFRKYKIATRGSEERLVELAKSIEERGLQTPPILAVLPDGTTGTMSGHFRLDAIFRLVRERYPDTYLEEINKTLVPVVYKRVASLQEIHGYTIIECQPKKELCVYDLALAVHKTLQDRTLGMSAREFALQLGWTESRVSQYKCVAILFLNLKRLVGKRLSDKLIERCRLDIDDPKYIGFTIMRELAYTILQGDLTTAQSKDVVRLLCRPKESLTPKALLCHVQRIKANSL